jgi:hypothetical protein
MIVLALVVARVTETYSGGRFDPFAPYSSDVNIEDVSAGLSHAFWRSLSGLVWLTIPSM